MTSTAIIQKLYSFFRGAPQFWHRSRVWCTCHREDDRNARVSVNWDRKAFSYSYRAATPARPP